MSSSNCLIRLLLIILTQLNPGPAGAGQNYRMTLDAQSFQANNAVSINQFDGDFLEYRADSPRLHALLENSAHIRAEKSGFALQLYKRQEAFLSASSATAQLYSDINSSLVRSITRSYPLQFQGYGIEQTGLGFEKRIETASIARERPAHLAAQVRVYNIDRYREVQVDGFAEARAPGSYSAAVVAVDRNSRQDEPGVQNSGKGGVGYGLDLGGRLPVGSRLDLVAEFRDLFNTNRISSLPAKRQSLQGSVVVGSLLSLLRPLPEVQSQLAAERYSFRLPVKSTVGFDYLVNQPYLHEFGFRARKIEDLTLTRFSLSWRNPVRFLPELEIGYESHFQSIDVLTRFGFGGLRIGADSLDDEKRRVEYLQIFFNADI
ncbi:MAG TPA: hypothetical protein VFV28_11040 [Limnobacter sp.]|nr:hypothetical protein [Limnobacter sp.]